MENVSSFELDAQIYPLTIRSLIRSDHKFIFIFYLKITYYNQ
jgi:hypothetical protein